MIMTSKVDSPLVVKRHISAPRQRVWEVLADGWTYSQWVVGNSRMRAVDPSWPAPGSAIHHTIGIWPFALDDETVVESSVPLQELVLLAKGRPLAGARITLRLFDTDEGCRIEMSEVPVNPPLRWIPDQLSLAAAWPRNRECTRRLAALVERHKSPQ